MSNPIKFTSTTESINVLHEGKLYTVKEGSANFNNLRKALATKDWDAVLGYLTITSSVTKWSNAKFILQDDESVYFEGEKIAEDFSKRIFTTAANGEDPTPLLNFYEKLKRNPSKRSVDQLWKFLDKTGIPITKDGCFLAYKGVNDDLTDKHTGTITNTPGAVVKLPRNSVSDDPNEACHFGLHVGAKRYASSFGSTVVICKVSPEHVVCVPYDSSHEKMRTCEYEVIGFDGQTLPDTTYDDTLDNQDSLEDDVAEVVKIEVKSTVKNKPSATVETKVKSEKKLFHDFNKLGTPELMKISIEDLRKYASHDLKIVGASKIPGGKVALIKKITKVRR